MKKTLLLASLAAAFSTPAMAEPTLYGDFRASVVTGDLAGDTSTDFVNNASRVGIKGSQGNDNLKAIYHLQMGANQDTNDTTSAALTSRFYFAGLQGSMGKLIYGRLSTPYKMTGVKQDPFYDTSAGLVGGGSNYGYSSLINGFSDNSFAYYSPKMGGLSFNASYTMADEATQKAGAGVGIEYAAGGMKFGLNHLMLDGAGTNVALANGTDSATRIYAGAKMGALNVNASYEMVAQASGDDAKFTNLNATYNATKAMKLAASYGQVSGADGVSGSAAKWNADGSNVTAGAFYNVLPKTTVHAMYTATSLDSGTDKNGLAVGIKQGF
ncbi:porin [Thiomicrorhabdus sp. 6S2-11]|uniref:Porin n=1 Tax=Thiomicrorhabdus marina TaxID=2818442 RepID=A0ABS3Q3I0_9GAMM|nr:porin [Thiomicrorhabdus marina]MBO1926703.1 porin [Thiomicrorhabdus marina]